MKRVVWLFVTILSSATLLHGQNSNPKNLSGTICQSSCLTQVNNVNTCDRACTDKSGEAVLIDDEGNIKKIANQDICKSHMGKRVKVKAVLA